MNKCLKPIVVVAASLFLISCGGTHTPSSQNGSPVKAKSKQKASKNILAEVNGQPITEADLQPSIAEPLARIESQIFDLKRQALTKLINEQLIKKEASQRGLSTEELFKAEVNDKIGTLSDEEIAEFYQQNRKTFGRSSLKRVKEKIRQHLFTTRAQIYSQNFLSRLKAQAEINIYLSRPPIEVSVDDDPMQGNPQAKVTIIEFTDFQCPFCGRARPTVKRFIADYGDQIRYVMRDFPLAFHPQAQKAAEATNCANEQGKYWEYTDLLWQNQGALQIPQLKKYARQLKLDKKQFNECLDSEKYTAEVKKDAADGIKAGVSGTPAFFINGELLSGARPLEQFKEVIDQKLREAKRPVQ